MTSSTPFVNPNNPNQYPEKTGKQEQDDLTTDRSVSQVANDNLKSSNSQLRHSQLQNSWKPRQALNLAGSTIGIKQQGQKDERKNPPQMESDKPSELWELEEDFTFISDEDEKASNPNQKKDEKIQRTAEKIEEASSWWNSVKTIGSKAYDGVAYIASAVVQPAVWLADWGITSYIGRYQSKTEKNRSIITNSKKEMLDDLHDPQFIEFFEFVQTFVGHIAKGKLAEKSEGYLGDKKLQTLILDLIEINIAKGFANIAKQINQNKETIPNFSNQPTLVNVLSLFGQKTTAHVNKARLAKIEEKYRESRASLPALTKQLFGDIDSERSPTVTSTKTKKVLINEYISITDAKRKKEIINQLFSHLKEGERNNNDVKLFIANLDVLNSRDKELHQIFDQVADDILIYLFPKRFADLVLPRVLRGTFGEWLYGKFAKDIIVTLLHQTYEPLEIDPNLTKKWEDDLQQRVGVPDLQALTNAPAALLLALSKHFIKTDPQVVDLVSGFLDIQQNEQTAENPDDTKKRKLIGQLSHQPLANWFVESIQAMLHTEDPNLLGLGEFTQHVLHKLTFALVAKGAALVISEDEKVEKDQLIKILTDRLVEKSKSFKAEQLSKKFWSDFIQDLPIPPLIKDLIVSILTEKAKSLQTLIPEESATDLKSSQAFDSDSEKALRAYPYGEVLLIVIKKISDQIVEQALEQNIGLVSALGMEDTIEELLVEFLPGVKINNSLKTWLKENIGAVGSAQTGQTAESIVKLKKQLEAVLRTAVASTIKTNFKNDSKAFAARLLQNIEEAFKKAFAPKQSSVVTGKAGKEEDLSQEDLQEIQRKQLEAINTTQREIQARALKIKELKQKIALKPTTLKTAIQNENNDHPLILANETKLLEEIIHTQIRYIQSSNYIDGLVKKRDKILDMLNQGQRPDQQWTVARLSQVNARTSFSGMSADQVQLVTEAVELEAAIKEARKDLNSLYVELTTKGDAIQKYNHSNVEKGKDWNRAVSWLYQTLDSNQATNQLYKEISSKENNGHSLISTDEMKLLEEIIHTQMRYIRSSNYIDDLVKKRDKILDKLNQGQRRDQQWTVAQLSQVNASTSFSGMSADQLQLVKEAVNLEATLNHARKELKYLFAELKAKGDAIQKYNSSNVEKREDWDKAVSWLYQTLDSNQTANQLYKEISSLEEKLELQLNAYKTLSQELMTLMGLSEKTQAEVVPSFLHSTVLPFIKSMHQHIARMLSEQITPMWLSILNIEKNKEKLIQLSSQDRFLAQLAKLASEEVMTRVSEYVTSYRPFAKQVLTLLGAVNPSEEQVSRMELALRNKMIALGKEGTTASMLLPLTKGCVAEENEEKLSKDLAQRLTDGNSVSISGAQCMQLLGPIPTDRRELKKRETSAQALANNLNQFLFNRGKTNLETQHLIEAYQAVLETNALTEDQVKNASEVIKNSKILDKIKAVVISPEEILSVLDGLLPGARELQEMLVPQIQQLLVGSDPSLEKNRKLIRSYIEGMLLQVFVKVAESNKVENQKVLAVLTQRLEGIAVNAHEIEGKSSEEVAQQMVDQILAVLGIRSEMDLEGMAPLMQHLVFQKIKEQAYKQLTPVMIPVIERNRNRDELNRLSGSPYLSSLAQGLCNDIFLLLPYGIKSVHVIAKELLELLSGQPNPPDDQVVELAKEISSLMQKSKEKNITHRALVDAYSRVTNTKLSSSQKKELINGLDRRKVKDEIYRVEDEINNILKSPEALVGAQMPTLDSNMQRTFAMELHGVIHENPEVYQNFAGLAKTYIEGMVIKIFINVAKKNPPQAGKNTLVVLTERLLALILEKYKQKMRVEATTPEAKSLQFAQFAEEVNNAIMKDVLGIESAAALEGLPKPLQATVYDSIKDYIKEMLISFRRSLENLESDSAEVKHAKENVKKFGVEAAVAKGYTEILSSDLANFIMAMLPGFLTEKVQSATQMRGVNLVSKGLGTYLESLARGNIEIAQVLLREKGTATQLQATLADNLQQFADANNLVSEKEKIVELLTHFFLLPLNRVLETTRAFEEQKGDQFNRAVTTKILRCVAHHFKNVNAAKKLAKQNGHTKIHHEDYVTAAGGRLHPGIPVAAVTYQETISAVSSRIVVSSVEKTRWEGDLYHAFASLISNENKGVKVISLEDIVLKIDEIYIGITGHALTTEQRQSLMQPNEKGLTLKELMRNEAEAPNLQRNEKFYIPTNKAILKVFYPRSQRDLVYVPEEYRGMVWKQLEKNFHLILPTLVELILSPDMINKIALQRLEKVRDVLKGEAKPSRDSVVRPVDDLDIASGEMIAEILKMMELPPIVKNQLFDEKGEVADWMKQNMGTMMNGLLGDTFIQDIFKNGIESAVQRNEDGSYALKFDASPPPSTSAKQANRLETKQKQKRVLRETVDAGSSFGIRYKWADVQARFDETIEKVFGKVGKKLKEALDVMFAFIFFKLLGTILSVLLYPIKKLVKEIIYHKIAHVDANRENLLGIFENIPEDQPLSAEYVAFNEDLAFNIVDAIVSTAEELANNPEVVA